MTRITHQKFFWLVQYATGYHPGPAAPSSALESHWSSHSGKRIEWRKSESLLCCLGHQQSEISIPGTKGQKSFGEHNLILGNLIHRPIFCQTLNKKECLNKKYLFFVSFLLSIVRLSINQMNLPWGMSFKLLKMHDHVHNYKVNANSQNFKWYKT